MSGSSLDRDAAAQNEIKKCKDMLEKAGIDPKGIEYIGISLEKMYVLGVVNGLERSKQIVAQAKELRRGIRR